MSDYVYTHRYYLLQKLRQRQMIQGHPIKDIALMNRIIKNGGFSAYIRKLEDQMMERVLSKMEQEGFTLVSTRGEEVNGKENVSTVH